MAAHGWRVGLLSEMPPEGRVGVSEVCVLGYNVNQVPGGRQHVWLRQRLMQFVRWVGQGGLLCSLWGEECCDCGT